MPQRLNFEHERDENTRSWQRSDPTRALIEPFGQFGYHVTLPGGQHHTVAIARDGDQYYGRCNDCKGFEYHTGPCAHLCTILKADFAGVEDITGQPVTISTVGSGTITVGPDDHHEQVRADGGVRRW